ncbi:MAG: hypothetical protein K8T20_20330 [Planctomycetes bacterium]|nr:hypothetical protein [Planctomycetota bacterium]
MVIPIGDENPRSRTPWVSWTFAVLTGMGYLLFLSSRRPIGGAFEFFISPVLASDPLTAAWSILAFVILADNVEERLGPLFHACLLIGAGWAGAAARAMGGPSELRPLLGMASVPFPFSGAGAAATAAAVAYAILFPLHQVKFFNLLAPRRRYRWSVFDMFDSGSNAVSETFYVTSPFGILLWGLGMLAGAFLGSRTGGTLASLIVGAMAGLGAGFLVRIKSGQPAFPSELEEPVAVPARSTAAAPLAASATGEVSSPATWDRVAPKPLQAPPPFAIGGWAVLRETDELYDVGRLGRVAAKYMGVPVADATRRIRQTRGVLARRLDRDRALAMAKAVTDAGVPAFAVWEEQVGGLPEAQMATSCGCNAGGMEFDLEGGRKAAFGWGDVAVITAARVDEKDQNVTVVDSNPAGMDAPAILTRDRVTQTTLIDVVTLKPPARFRVARQEAALGGAGDLSSAGFRQFATSALKNRGAAPVNKGLSVIASRGSWGYLAFDNATSYEEYLWWLLQVIRRRSGRPADGPAAAPPASGNAAAAYLE